MTAIADAIVSAGTYADPAAMDALFAQLRRDDPVHRVEHPEYRPFWAVTKFADIQEVERQADIFLNAPRTFLRTLAYEERARAATGGNPALLRSLVFMDAPDHARYRKLTQAWFMPGRIRVLEEEFRALANEVIDEMADRGGSCDFATEVAPYYPVRVIMRILGVPRSDEALILQLTQEIFGSDDPDVQASRTTAASLADTVKVFSDYFRDLTADRRRHPADDLATLFARAEIDGRPMADHESISYYILVATAGHDTTSSSTAGGLLALIQHPDELRRLRADPSLLPTAIDEMVRWVSPVRHFFRTATRDYDLRGRSVKAGDSLMMCYPSANRDEEIFDDPFAFRAGRPMNGHIAFGYGPHLCLGMHMARMEMRIFYEELLRRVADVGLAGDPAWLASTNVGGLKRLPIHFRMA
ncbi:cytochrome P450 [Sphingopyxis sp. BSN-002]|uniref:cytochrome P450 n=1 Tax=Sphingopyxis sp. BSN-002 TaxID=2911495 RepID=UPI001EDC5603|nr:cytochrome P450 [Sphingopyxis sp. BSN-002]UKK82858.1 cytochrome P450 [Sphingopyxis sp. BSN-002]